MVQKRAKNTSKLHCSSHACARSIIFYFLPSIQILIIPSYEDWQTLLFGNRTQVVELLVKCFTAQLCSRDINTCCWRGTTQSLRLCHLPPVC